MITHRLHQQLQIHDYLHNRFVIETVCASYTMKKLIKLKWCQLNSNVLNGRSHRRVAMDTPLLNRQSEPLRVQLSNLADYHFIFQNSTL